MKKKKLLTDILVYIILIVVLLVTLLPLIYTVLGSFKSNMEIMVHPDRFLPLEPTLDNYKEIFTSKKMDFPRMLFYSVYFTLANTAISVGIGTITGYVFARADFPGAKFIFALFTATMFISVSGITIYPMLRIMNAVGLGDTIHGVIVKTFFNVGVVQIYLVRGYVNQLPKELDEAAMIDGCGFISTFTRVILPNLKPIVATLTILAFKANWNEWYLPTLFTASRPEQRTLMVGLQALKNTGDMAASWNLMLAGATFSMLPILIVYAFCNKYFVEGITAGAVKG